MNEIRRFEKRVLQHSEYDDDEGFDENSTGYEILKSIEQNNSFVQTFRDSMNISDMEISSPYEQDTKESLIKVGTTGSQELVPYSKQPQTRQLDRYLLEIRRRLQEDVHARREREKRRRKVLVDQLRALEAIEVRIHSIEMIFIRTRIGFQT